MGDERTLEGSQQPRGLASLCPEGLGSRARVQAGTCLCEHSTHRPMKGNRRQSIKKTYLVNTVHVTCRGMKPNVKSSPDPESLKAHRGGRGHT